MNMDNSGDHDVSSKLNVTKKFGLALQSEDKRVRKQAFVDFQNALSDRDKFTDEDYHNMFKETHIYMFNGLRDNSEHVRDQTIKVITLYLLEILPINDYYLSYLFPVLLERLASSEIIEESEEIRLQLNYLIKSIIEKYSNTEQLKPFLNDFTAIFKRTVLDKYPAIKENSCLAICSLALALPRDFHMHAENLIAPVLTVFSHQRFKLRVVAIQCIGVLVMHSQCKGLEDSLSPLAERLFDQIPIVRRTVNQVVSRWLLEYRDRYSFFHKLLPLVLTGLNDEIEETRTEAFSLWKIVGLQFEKENETDLKDQLDFLIELPNNYPTHLTRPNLGCRVLVQRNVSKIAGALAKELSSWQADVRVRCSQLLCALALHAEEGITQHLQDLLPAMYTAARDDDQRVVVNIIQTSELLGNFVPVKTWLKMIVPAIEGGVHYGHLSVLAGLIRGSPGEYVSPSLDEISDVLVDNSVCYTRKMKLQRELILCVHAIEDKYSSESSTTGYNLFKIILSVYALRDVENTAMDLSELVSKLCTVLRGDNDVNQVWLSYVGDVLKSIGQDPSSWTVVTPERCIFEMILLYSGESFGENLTAIGEILVKTLDTECDPESRLKTFVALSTAMENKDVIFKTATIKASFLKTLITEVILPSLVWHAGRIAEAMRTIAASCLSSALQPSDNVTLIDDKSVLRSWLDKLIPLLLSLSEDGSYRSRHLALENLVLLKELAAINNCWFVDELIKIYPEILKRFDDPNDKVRLCAIQSMLRLFMDTPMEFNDSHYKAHHELILDTLMTHFDDLEYGFSDDILEILKIMPAICTPEYCKEKILRHKPLLRNQEGCEKILEHLNGIKIN